MSRATRTLLLAISVTAVWAAVGAASASADFGLKNVEVTFTKADEVTAATQAGSHPFQMRTVLDINTIGDIPDGELKDVRVKLPVGFAGDPNAVPQCSSTDFLKFDDNASACPNSTAVGVVGIRQEGKAVAEDFAPVYNLVPSPGAPAKLGFHAIAGVAVTISFGLSEESPQALFSIIGNVPQAEPNTGAELTIWGVPADPVHDALRGKCVDGTGTSQGICPAGVPERPFITLPRSCSGPLVTTFRANSWQNPLVWDEKEAFSTEMDGCENLEFEPSIEAEPTTQAAESASGLDFAIGVDDPGLQDPDENAMSDIKKVVAKLPEGMTVNPSAANGLVGCGKAEFEAETLTSVPGQGCPAASKIGSIEVETPLLEGEVIKGSLYQAQQDDPTTATPEAENPFDSFLALYVVLRSPELGIFVKQAGTVEPDPLTGRLVSVFDDLPQLPFSHFRLHFREGPRGPLVTPPTCGEHTTEAVFTPWADPSETFTSTSTFEVTSGLGGGACQVGPQPFRPTFEAGSVDSTAGSYSPFYMRITRQDGEQELTRFDSILPPGLVGKLAGVAKCPDAAIEAAKGRTGKAEQATPSCPAASQIGSTLAGAGVGSVLTYVPGKLYLAGPYGGKPLSIVAITPAVAGPIDAGTVVVREALTLDQYTAEVQVDGASSDPIPRILKGVPLRLRDLRISVDRDKFTLNPTSCDPMTTKGTLFGNFLNVFTPADDVPVSVGDHYQATNCGALGFQPRLSLTLKGGTRRSAFPALKAVVRPRPGDANFASAVVTLPHSAFLEQSHIRTICTRAQFAANQCPRASIYGKAKAITPLLDEPLEGPVYLRSSGNQLPDLVAALKGVVDVTLVARIDSVNARIRSTFETIPDAPVSEFILEMQGGKKGLIVNSRNLCVHKSRARGIIVGQNGKLTEVLPVVKPTGCKKKKKKQSNRIAQRASL